jgi:CubicO group peptidase (beta-lactamase class C family)
MLQQRARPALWATAPTTRQVGGSGEVAQPCFNDCHLHNRQAHRPMSSRRSLVLSGVGAGVGLGLFSGGALGAAPPAPGPSAQALAEALQAGESLPGLRALLVAHRGVVVAERYYGGATADMLQPVNSVTKSVCALLVGLALRDGRLKRLDDTVAQLLPEALAEVPDSPAANVTLRQILAGRTGMAYDPMRFGQLVGAANLVRYALSRPALPVPPPGWSYNDAMVSLLAPLLARAQGSEHSVLAARQLFEPLGIERFEWRRDRQGQPLAAAGLSLRPRDLLKLPALMADGGRWNGTQVVPETWVTECLTPQGPATWRAGPVEDVGYGLLWFTGRLHGQRVAWAWGYGGQFALLAPELKLAVATAATSPPPSALREQTDALMALVGRVVQAAA